MCKPVQSLPKLGACTYVAAGYAKNHKKCSKNSENLRSVFSPFVLPPPGDATEQFNISAPLHSLWYVTASKNGLNMYILYLFWCTLT